MLGQLSEPEENPLRLRVKQLICGSLNGMRSPGRSSGWVLEFRDYGAIPVQVLLLTAGRWTVVGNACGGKLGSHGSKAILLSHA